MKPSLMTRLLATRHEPIKKTAFKPFFGITAAVTTEKNVSLAVRHRKCFTVPLKRRFRPADRLDGWQCGYRPFVVSHSATTLHYVKGE